MKKLSILFLVLILSLALVACNGESAVKDENQKPIVTVTTTFLEDMVYQLAADAAEIKLIIPAGEDPHLYLAKPEDLSKIKDADLLLYHGLHFEGKMLDALEPTGKEVTKNFDHSKLGEMDQDGETIVDPHFWFNIELYKQATENAATELKALLPDQAEKIEQRKDNYLVELDKLDAENKAATLRAVTTSSSSHRRASVPTAKSATKTLPKRLTLSSKTKLKRFSLRVQPTRRAWIN